jgi:hypothetical protein
MPDEALLLASVSRSRTRDLRRLAALLIVIPVVFAPVLWWAFLRPSIWDLEDFGALVGRPIESSWRQTISPDQGPKISGWTRTCSRPMWIDWDRVLGIRLDEHGVVVECAIFDGKHPHYTEHARWGRKN